MSIIEVQVPQLSESVAEGTLLPGKRKSAKPFRRDEILIDIETDKVVLEVPSPGAGVMVEIIKGDGETVVSGELIARIDTAATATQRVLLHRQLRHRRLLLHRLLPAPAAPAGTASPSARKILDEKGVAAADVAGSGRGGRVTKEDAVAAAAEGYSGFSGCRNCRSGTQSGRSYRTARTDDPSACPYRRASASIEANQRDSDHVQRSQHGPGHGAAQAVCEKFEKQHGVRLGFMGFFVKAACAALQKFPVLNASVDGNDIVYHGYIDIGIAVGSPRGLVVPIIRNADQLSIAEIEKKIAEFGAKAKDGKLSMEELSGGTFSISNGGVFGSMLSTRSSTRRNRRSSAFMPPRTVPWLKTVRSSFVRSTTSPCPMTTASSTVVKPFWAW
jgi:2-oxoglutarate dehydrogenase E2 component (dihydrolipoamide succinyltransferase)